MIKRLGIFLLQFLFLQAVEAQRYTEPFFAAQIGVSCSFGTHVQRIGIMSRLTYVHDWAQLHLEQSLLYNFKSTGTEEKGWEWVLKPGFSGSWGQRDSLAEIHPFLHASSIQTARPYGLSYAYIFYSDQHTRQNSGVFGFQVNNFRFFFENDFLAFQSMDKFRTGAMGFYYRWGHWQFSLKNISYTGDPYSSTSPWIEDTHFPSASGYIDMSTAPYGDKSMGVISLQVERHFPVSNGIPFLFDQYVGVEMGIDAEQIRNVFQNKLIHDSKLLPLNWNEVKNPHIPMIANDGCPYLYQSHQSIRAARFFLQFHNNNTLFY